MNEPGGTTLQMVTVRWWNASAYYAVSVARALQMAGYPSIVASPEHYPATARARQANLTVFSGARTESLNPLRILGNLVVLKRFITHHNIRFLNAHRPEDHAHAALLRAVMNVPIPVIRTVTDVRFPKKHALNRRIHQRYTDYFIFSSRSSVERYQSVWPFFEEGKNYTIIPGGIDTDYFTPRTASPEQRTALGIDRDAVVFGLIARLSPVKGHRVFLEAAAQVHRRFPNTRFLISGEAVEITHAELQEYAQTLGIAPAVIFQEKAADVREVIEIIDVGVVASLDSEVVCRIGMEMMAMGKPVIATRVNVLPELIEDGGEGILVPPGDASALARAMEHMLMKPDIISRMGKQARRRVETEYSLPVLAQKTWRAYERALQHFKQVHS